jgi:hypothetical protein
VILFFFAWELTLFSFLSSVIVSDLDELCFDFLLSPSLCFLFSGRSFALVDSAVGILDFFIGLECGASASSSLELSEEDDMEPALRNPAAGASIISWSEDGSGSKPIGWNRIFKPEGC